MNVSVFFVFQESADVQPSFEGGSFIQLPVPAGISFSTVVDILIYPTNAAGVILYGRQSSEEGTDFIVVGLENQRVYLRINLGETCHHHWYKAQIFFLRFNICIIRISCKLSPIGINLEFRF